MSRTSRRRHALRDLWRLFSANPNAYQALRGGVWHAFDFAPSDETLRGAFAGTSPIAATFLGPDSSTNVGAIDVDDPDGWPLVLRAGRTLRDAGIPAYVDQSRRGGHVRVLLAERAHARTLRAALKVALRASGWTAPVDVGFRYAAAVAVRPSVDFWQNTRSGGSLRLPLNRHPKTGERYPILDPLTGKVAADSIGELLNLERADVATVERLAREWDGPSVSATLGEAVAANARNAAAGLTALDLWEENVQTGERRPLLAAL